MSLYGEALYGSGIYSTDISPNPNASTQLTWDTDDFGTWTAYLGWNGAGFVVMAQTGESAFLLDDPVQGLLNESVLGPTADGWIDLGCDLISLDLGHGASTDGGVLLRAEAGQCQLVLNNMDLTYEPFVTDQFPLGLGTTIAVLGHNRESVEALVSSPELNPWGNLHRLFTGKIESITCSGYETEAPVAEILAVDDVLQLQNYNGLEQTPVGAGDTTEERVNRILDNAQWSVFNPSLGAEVSTCDFLDQAEFNPTHQATTLAQPAWEMMLRAADAANRVIYFKGNGQPSCEALYPTLNDDWLQYNWGCANGEYPTVAIEVAFDKTQLVNVVDAAAAGGSQITVTDETSVARHGPFRWGRNDLTLEDDLDVATFAGFIVQASSEPIARVTSLRIVPSVWPSDDLEVDEEFWNVVDEEPNFIRQVNAWGFLCDLIGAPIRGGFRHKVNAPIPGTDQMIEDTVAFRGVRFHLDADTADVEFVTSSIRQFIDLFILDDNVQGILDAGHRVS